MKSSSGGGGTAREGKDRGERPGARDAAGDAARHLDAIGRTEVVSAPDAKTRRSKAAKAAPSTP
jgi:hypothetical protein